MKYTKAELEQKAQPKERPAHPKQLEAFVAPSLRLAIEVPIRLVSALNAREHWRQRAARTKQDRAVVGLLLQAHAPAGMRGMLARTPASKAWVMLTRVAPGRLDGDNLQGAGKAVRDEIAAFLGLDDRNDDRFAWVYEQARAREYAVQIAVEVTF